MSVLNLVINQIRRNTTVYNGVLFTVFSFINTGINFILLIVLSRYLTPTEYGYLNLFNTFILLMTIFVSLNTEKIIVVNYFKVDRIYTGETITSIIFISFLISTFVSLCIIITKSYIEPEIGFSIIYLFIATWYCFLNLLSSINLAIWKAYSNPIKFGLYSISIVLFNTLFTILFIAIFHFGWISRAYAQFGISIIFGVISIIFLIKKQYLGKNIIPKKAIIKEVISFGLPLVPNAISWWAMQGVNRFIINSYYGPAEVGFYSFASNLSNIMLVIGIAFSQSFHVDVFKTLTEKLDGYSIYLSKFTNKMIIIYFVISFLLYALCYIFTPLIFPNFKDANKFLLPLCISAFAHSVNQLYVCYLFYHKKTKLLMNIMVIVSTLNVLFGFILIKYNLLMAAYIFMISEIIIAFAYIYYANKLEAIKII